MPTKNLCSIDGCRKTSWERGWCKMHYNRWHRHGCPHHISIVFFADNDQQIDYIQTYLLSCDTDECMEWPFSRNTKGCATIRMSTGENKRSVYPIICRLAHGEPPTSKHVSAHSCGNGHKGCVNPKHIRWATQKENMADRDRHGRTARGESVGRVKLSEDKVKEIVSTGYSIPVKELAERYGVTRATIRNVLGRKTWKHLIGNPSC